jgi:hypothetical protein
MLRSFDLESNLKNLKNKKIIDLIIPFNQLHGHQAIRSTYHTTMQETPCQLVFGRDMILDIALRENCYLMKERTEHDK